MSTSSAWNMHPRPSELCHCAKYHAYSKLTIHCHLAQSYYNPERHEHHQSICALSCMGTATLILILSVCIVSSAYNNSIQSFNEDKSQLGLCSLQVFFCIGLALARGAVLINSYRHDNFTLYHTV